jgi:UDP-2-acetamido-3-amino-2,3-dideoxy-glucuronate N-acetyltransferase
LNNETLISRKALVSNLSHIEAKVTVWHWSQIRENARVGNNSSIGQHVYIGPGVEIGIKCKIQNGAQLFEPAVLEDGVFIGPNVVLTNDLNPRAVTTESFSPKSELDWQKFGVKVKRGASIGAGAICVAPVIIGEWSLVGAGSVVVADVPPHALVVGNPARQIGWVGESGLKLKPEGKIFICPGTGDRYALSSANVLAKVGLSA